MDVFAARVGPVLQSQAVSTYSFPKAIVADAGPLPPPVINALGPLETSGLRLSQRQTQLTAALSQAIDAASINDWSQAKQAYSAALQTMPDAPPVLRGAITHDLAIATEKSGGDVATSVKLAQDSANLFATANAYSAQVEALKTLAGIQARGGDTGGSDKTLSMAGSISATHRLFPVQLNRPPLVPIGGIHPPLASIAVINGARAGGH